MSFSSMHDMSYMDMSTTSNANADAIAMKRIEPECSAKCRSKKDAATLIASITRGTDQQSLGYIFSSGICNNPGKVGDEYGRTLLHMAAAMGKKAVVEWLIKYKGAQLNTKDSESGYTALHRALFYGHINVARFLIENGSNIAVQDHEGLTPIDHVNKDRSSFCPFNFDNDTISHTDQVTAMNNVAGGLGEGYVWGTNENFNLGLGHHQQKNQPVIIEQLRRSGNYISKVVLQKFHSAVLTTEGSILTFGHGQGGRLGHGNEDSQLSPRCISTLKDSIICVDIALGVDHSMFLGANGTIYVCGSNTSYQLGLSGTSQSAIVVTPQSIGGSKISNNSSSKSSSEKQFSSAIGIAASRYHSLFWTKDALYTWGLNAGQLGHIKSDNTTYITVPRLVSSLNQKDVEIIFAATSEGAIVVNTNNGDLIAMYEYQTKKRITSVRITDICKIEVIGGHLDPSRVKNDELNYTKLTEKGGKSLKVFVLTKSGKIYIWEEGSKPGLIQCVFNLNRQLLVQDIAINRTNLMIISKDGNGYEAIHVNRKNNSVVSNQRRSTEIVGSSPPKANQFISTLEAKTAHYDLIRIKQRLLGIHRGVSVVCDPKGKNFCVVQVAPNASLFDIPDITQSKMNEDMQNLFEENFNGYQSPLHDLMVKTRFGNISKFYHVHSFILANSSAELAAMILKSKSQHSAPECDPITLELNDVRPELFEQCLRYAYTRTCDLIKPGPCSFKITSEPEKAMETIDASCQLIKDISLDEDLNVDENSSAYNIQQINKRKKKKSTSDRAKEKRKSEANEKEFGLNPLSLLNDLAHKLGIIGLCKQLSNYKYLGDSIVDTRQQFWRKNDSAVKNSFSRKSYPEFHDVVILSEDEVEFSAHRCILSARLEYFNSMFSLGWIETAKNKKLKLPVHSKVLTVLLEFIYRDESPLLNKSEDVEFICQVLAVADQLLVPRLVQMCEREASNLLTLKNCADILQVANDFSAQQLARSASQFICHNLATLLESQSLNGLTEECVENLTKYYFDSFPTLHHRKITPYYNAPSSDILEEANYSIEDVFECEEDLASTKKQNNTATPDDFSGKKFRNSIGKNRNRTISGESYSSGEDLKSNGKKHRRTRNRRSSCESVSSLGSSESEDELNISSLKNNEDLDVEDFGLVERKQEQPFTKVHDKKEQQRKSNEFVSSLLRLPYKQDKPDILTTPPVLKPPVTPEDINNLAESKPELQSQSSSKMVKFTKLSQKERKRLNSEQSQLSSKSGNANQTPEADKPKWGGWGSKNSDSINSAPEPNGYKHDIMNGNTSLEEIMKSQKHKKSPERDFKSSETSISNQSAKKPKAWRVLDFNEPSKTITPAPIPSKNPWQIKDTNNSPITQTVESRDKVHDQKQSSSTFQEIMHQETIQKQNLHRIQSKSLAITQIEEQAIEELKNFYNVDNVFEELITIKRANTSAMATPVWNPRK